MLYSSFSLVTCSVYSGTPLQYSCLENPMDGGAWWAAVHGVAKSRDTTEGLHFHFSLSCIREGNGNPLQCSCLENPRDGGAWWAAICGVAQSRTRLKQLSSSSKYFLNHVNLKFSLKERKKVKSLSHVRLFATPWTVAYQAPPSMGFSRQEYWSGVPLPSKCFTNTLVFV